MYSAVKINGQPLYKLARRGVEAAQVERKPRKAIIKQLEMLEDLIVRDEYSVLDIGTCEGIDIWKFIQLIAGDVPGVDDPVSVTVYASDGYKNDLLSVFFREGLVNGVSGDTGDPKKLIIAYALNGYPLVDEESHEGNCETDEEYAERSQPGATRGHQ